MTAYRKWQAFAAMCLALACVATAARAQDATAVTTDPTTQVKANVVGPGSGAAAPRTLVDPANGGIAGTGLGKMPKSDVGTGMSVKGPPGMGIEGTKP